ncbi:hypothetical protein Bp8pS_012 [Bacillus phage vB_BpuM-BpSp]|nr:hypothetical protein Bp8pS_012 [Bacillus phage vB_BpuM-BpSp]
MKMEEVSVPYKSHIFDKDYRSKNNKNKGYHKRAIEKGKYGEFSKIEEEVLEAKDALEQEQYLMLAIELSDIIGAVKGFAENNNMDFNELLKFAELNSKVKSEENV